MRYKPSIPLGVLKFKYTYGKEYILESKEYVGYYYELSNEAYAGKEFSATATKLIKILTGSEASLSTYKAISNDSIPPNINPVPYVFRYETEYRYFSYHQVNKQIMEIDKNTFDIIKSNPIYIVISLYFNGGFADKEVLEAEKQIPGIKTFTDNSYIRPTAFSDGADGFEYPEDYKFNNIIDNIESPNNLQ